ncbi:MAG: thioredoxin family protein [Thermoanaerobaculia bacterium]
MPSRVLSFATRSVKFLSLAVLLHVSSAVLAAGDKGDLVKWRPLAAGEAESRSSKKPVLYFLTADWCGPCHTMKEEVFTDPALAALINKQFVPVQVVDRRRETGQNAPEVDDVFRRFQLNGFPTLVVSRPQGKQGFSAAGWSNKSATKDFLTMAKGRLAEMEKAAKE